jgi:hypothetical protein
MLLSHDGKAKERGRSRFESALAIRVSPPCSAPDTNAWRERLLRVKLRLQILEVERPLSFPPRHKRTYRPQGCRAATRPHIGR